MSTDSQNRSGRVALMRLALIAVLCSIGTLAVAQEPAAPKWEIFGGYSFFYPGADIHGVQPGGVLPVSSQLESNPRGAGASLSYNFNRWLGLTADVSGDRNSGESGLADRIDDTAFYNLSLGPKITFRSPHFSPFLEALGGDHRLSPDAFHAINKLGFMAGGGLDVNLSRHIALRLIRADYVFSTYRYGTHASTLTTDIRGARLQAGIVFLWGGERTVIPPSAACSVQPIEVWAGEPVTATAEASNFNPRRTVTYNWSGPGASAGATGATTQIDTAGLQPGSYQITASLSDGRKNGAASCRASFTVKTPHPPQISCSADPASVPMGGTSAIRSNASSPDGRSLTYGYTTSAGTISGNDSTATLNSSGAQPGTINVTCTVSDDRNPALMASASTSVYLQPPPPPPPLPDVSAIEKRLALHSVYFATAKPSEEKPDGGLLPSQERTLTTLAGDFRKLLESRPDARLTLEGHADPRGGVEYNQGLSERRVDRTRRFLIEQGVPAANIETKAFGEQQNLTDAEVKDAIERNPELSPQDRQRVLRNMRTIILASNRRVDITLHHTGQGAQESVREYPFNAADSLTLLKEERTGKTTMPAAGKKAKTKAKP